MQTKKEKKYFQNSPFFIESLRRYMRSVKNTIGNEHEIIDNVKSSYGNESS